MRVSLLILILLTGCAKSKEVKMNVCGGVQVPICEHSYTPSPLESVEEQEKKLKQSMIRVMTLMLDQMTQHLLESMAP